MLRIILLVFILVSTRSVFSQTDSGTLPLRDTVQPKDSAPIARDSPMVIRRDSARVPRREPVRARPADSVIRRVNADTLATVPVDEAVSKKAQYPLWKLTAGLPISFQLLQHHPYFGFGSKPVIVHSDIKMFRGKEVLFYALIGLLLAYALLKQAFPKYFNDMFRLLFRNTLKQKQIREQLMQTPFPSLLLNAFFAVSAGMYVNLLLHHFGVAPIDNFWLLLFYCSVGLCVIYFIKFIGLKITGWLFNVRGAADSYIFVVFIINKVIGIFLLPFIVILAFMQGTTYNVIMVLSWCGLGILYIYRFLLTYASIRNQVRFNPFHFFLYLCAFEIAPLLLIYKALLFFFP